ncbi:MAG: beta-eliminating lyase-related protein, partial [Luminiphilus sp.]
MASLIIASRYNMGIGGGKPCNNELTAQKSEQQSDMNFISDNQAGAHPAVLAAISDAAAGLAEGYGEDALTAAAESAVRDVFETDCAVFFVTTGTAANALAMSALCPPWGAIYCHEGA